MSEPTDITYRVAEGGPFNLTVDNGVTIENITDDLVNAGILVPLTDDEIEGQRQADYTHGWKDCMKRFGIQEDSS